jgi:hypothetical protein
VERDAVRTLRRHERVGQQMLHRLEGSDGHPVLVPLARVVAGEIERTAHHADEVRAGDRQRQTGPPIAVVCAEHSCLSGHLDRRR